MENHRFRNSVLDKQTFSITWELVPGRGAREKSQEAAMRSAEQAATGGKIHAVSMTDNPGGNPAILPDQLGQEISRLGIDSLIHFTCKDRNRNQIESQLYALDRAGINNLLVMTGDYPRTGLSGRPKAVFDLDSTHALKLISKMNAGLEIPGPKGSTYHQPSNFFAGAAVSPFKAFESEQMSQYFKLKKKIAAGAQFIVTQLGYDARKFHEVLEFMKLHNLNVPVIGNIYVLSFGAAKLMNANQIPGCVVTDKLLSELDKERTAEDKGLAARLLRAAKMYALMKGMGFAGVHLGGHNISYEQVEYIIDKGEELTPRWRDFIPEFDYPMTNGFYYFEKDQETGLNSDRPVNRNNLPLEAPVGSLFWGMWKMHALAFTPGIGLFSTMQKIYVHKDPQRYPLEHTLKAFLYDCKDCGDCALLDLAYLCPMSQCPKYQRNGQCGGSFQGWCEVFPGQKQCIYVRAFARLKKYREEELLDSYHIPPADWDLFRTSSWYNYYLGRDHSAITLGITPPESVSLPGPPPERP